MQNIAETTRFVTSNNGFCLLTKFTDPLQEGIRLESLWRFGRLPVSLLDNNVLILVDIKSKLDNFRFRFSLFMWRGSVLSVLIFHSRSVSLAIARA